MKFDFDATAIGSVPFESAKRACPVIFENFRRIPFWPQLPKRSYLENMYIQYSERLPGLVLNQKNKTVHIDTSRVPSEIEEVYGKFLEGDVEYFSISEDYAEGLYAFLDWLPKAAGNISFAKGHITGPISYGLTLTDENKRSVIYDKDLFEVMTKTLCMKARWQIRKLKERSPQVIIFIDEPYLVSIGSSYVTIDQTAAFGALGDVISAVKEEGALAGIHCCGNTDWPLLLKSGVDILNLDAYNFMREFSLYSGEIDDYLNKGSAIAWGIVPSMDAIDKESVVTLTGKLRTAVKFLTDKGIPAGKISSLVTPSCGVGSLDEARAVKALEITASISKEFQGNKNG